MLILNRLIDKDRFYIVKQENLHNMRKARMILPVFILCSLYSATGEAQSWNIVFSSLDQNYNTNVGYMAVVENGEPNFELSGSGMWISEAGYFLTTKHAYRLENDMTAELVIFFNGERLKGCIDKIWPDKDVAVIKVCNGLYSGTAPVALKLASNLPESFAQVDIRGIHAHPVVTNDYDYDLEFRFEIFGGKVATINKRIPLEYPNGIQFLMDDYLEIIVSGNHTLPFRGLSGGAVMNENGELIAMVVGEVIASYEYTSGVVRMIPGNPTHTIYALPLTNIAGLKEYIEGLR